MNNYLAGADVNIPATEGEPKGEPAPGYVRDFLHKNNPNVLHSQDMKHGGNPLHWACSREVITALIETNCDIDALNFDRRTALHIMVMRKRLDCVVALLSHMASTNPRDNEGNTPLHLAVAVATPSIVQILVGFGADLEAKNDKGETPRHVVSDSYDGQSILYILHSVGAQRCPPTKVDCKDGCKHGKEYNGEFLFLCSLKSLLTTMHNLL